MADLARRFGGVQYGTQTLTATALAAFAEYLDRLANSAEIRSTLSSV